MTDPILLMLTIDAVALGLLGALGPALPSPVGILVATSLSGLGLAASLLPLLAGAPPAALPLPVGPPGLSLHLALDPLSLFFLAMVFLAATAIAAFQATAKAPAHPADIRATALCLAGTAFTLLAADAVALAIGLAVTCGAVAPRPNQRFALLVPLLLLAAIGVLGGTGPGFTSLRIAVADPARASAAAALVIAAVAALSWPPAAERCWTRDALAACVVIPSGAYLLLRLVAGLPDPATPSWCGFALLLGGGAIAATQAWRAATHPGIDGAAICLARRQAGLAITGIGLALIARTADLPGAEALALATTFLGALCAALPGVLTLLVARAIGTGAGADHLSRLGGLVHTMPATSAAFAAALLGVSAIPPGLGFAGLWLLFQAILAAPRTGGLLLQLPLGLAGAAIAFSSGWAGVAAVRLVGIAVLGRPRTPRGAGAQDGPASSRMLLLGLAALSVLLGLLPETILWLLADPAIRGLTGDHSGVAWGVSAAAAPGYLAFPVLALLALATLGTIAATRWRPKAAKVTGAWTSGMAPPAGLPFGEPAAQSAGAGFLPSWPRFPLPRLHLPPSLPHLRPPSAAFGLWLLLAAFAAALLALGVVG